MIILDTNVASELMRPVPNERVVAWVDRQAANETYLTAITVAELLYGVGRLADGRRKAELASLIDAMVAEDYDGQVAPFDEVAAGHYADIVVQRERLGRPIGMADAQIAAICRSYDATLVTRNVDDFEHTLVTIVDPWKVSD